MHTLHYILYSLKINNQATYIDRSLLFDVEFYVVLNTIDTKSFLNWSDIPLIP